MIFLDLTQFNRCDQCILNILGIHLAQKESNELECSQIVKIITQFREILKYTAVISLSKDGNIEFITKRAMELLSQYFSEDNSSNSLPHHLSQWFNYQISQFSLDDDPFATRTLHIEKNGKELIIYFINFVKNKTQEDYLLILEEKKTKIFSINELELLGLTKREAEVLFWVAKDKSNIEIAKVIGCGESTIGKHLENIRRKLNVHTRTGAIMVALEKLGILR